jgi:hypothetical protein
VASVFASTAAQAWSIHKDNQMKSITELKRSNPLERKVLSWATGVAIVGTSENPSGCTAFLIGQDTMMTNHHCKGTVTSVFKGSGGGFGHGLFSHLYYLYMMNPDPALNPNLLLGNYRPVPRTPVPEDMDEFIKVINESPEKLGWVNFNNVELKEGEEAKPETFRITKVIAASKELDMLVFKIDRSGRDKFRHVFSISSTQLSDGDELVGLQRKCS